MANNPGILHFFYLAPFNNNEYYPAIVNSFYHSYNNKFAH